MGAGRTEEDDKGFRLRKTFVSGGEGSHDGGSKRFSGIKLGSWINPEGIAVRLVDPSTLQWNPKGVGTEEELKS